MSALAVELRAALAALPLGVMADEPAWLASTSDHVLTLLDRHATLCNLAQQRAAAVAGSARVSGSPFADEMNAMLEENMRAALSALPQAGEASKTEFMRRMVAEFDTLSRAAASKAWHSLLGLDRSIEAAERANAKPAPALVDFKPLENWPALDVINLLECAGFHTASAASRAGCNAFMLRADVSMGELCLSINQRQRALRSILRIVAWDESTPEPIADVIAAALIMVQESAGFHAALSDGVEMFGRPLQDRGR